MVFGIVFGLFCIIGFLVRVYFNFEWFLVLYCEIGFYIFMFIFMCVGVEGVIIVIEILILMDIVFSVYMFYI